VAGGAIRALRTLPRKLAMSIGIGQTAATAAAGVSIPIVVTPIRLNATLSAHLTVPISIRNDGWTMKRANNRLIGGIEPVGHRFGIGTLLARHNNLLLGKI